MRVSPCWLEAAVRCGRWVDPAITALYRPLRGRGAIPGMGALRVATSGLRHGYRERAHRLIGAAGARLDADLETDPASGQTSHVVCAIATDGKTRRRRLPKLRAARTWNENEGRNGREIHVVTLGWLEASVSRWEMAREDDFAFVLAESGAPGSPGKSYEGASFRVPKGQHFSPIDFDGDGDGDGDDGGEAEDEAAAALRRRREEELEQGGPRGGGGGGGRGRADGRVGEHQRQHARFPRGR